MLLMKFLSLFDQCRQNFSIHESGLRPQDGQLEQQLLILSYLTPQPLLKHLITLVVNLWMNSEPVHVVFLLSYNNLTLFWPKAFPFGF